MLTSLPSSCRVNHLPLVPGSSTDSTAGVLPTWWVLGHHRSIFSVKTLKAVSWLASTSSSFRMGSIVIFVFLSLLGNLLEAFHRLAPEAIQILPQRLNAFFVNAVNASRPLPRHRD